MKQTKVWAMSLDQAIEFFEKSLYKEAVKQEEKEKILDEMKIDHVVVEGTPEDITAALSKTKRVLHLKRKINGTTKNNRK